MQAHPNTLGERERAAWIGFRQTQSDFDYRVTMQFNPAQEEIEAGIGLVQKDDFYLLLTVDNYGAQWCIKVTQAHPQETPRVVHSLPVGAYDGQIDLIITSGPAAYQLAYQLPGAEPRHLLDLPPSLFNCRGYTGAYLGLYATAHGRNVDEAAYFDQVVYRARDRAH